MRPRTGIPSGANRGKKRTETSFNRSIYLRERFFKYFSKVAENKNVSFNRAIDSHFEETVPFIPESLPDECFGEFLHD